MTSREFCYWLRGYFELESKVSNHPEKPVITQEQAVVIKNHLDMVFLHEIDPSYGDKTKQDALNAIHNQPPKSELLMRC